MSLKKFSRGANYSEEEKTLLLSVINCYLGVIGNKKTDAAAAREKDRAWGMIAVDYNAKSKSYRSKVSLKTCYDNLKKAARKTQMGNIQKFKTDGQVNLKPKTLYLVLPGPAMPLAARVVGDATTTAYNLNALKGHELVSDCAERQGGGATENEGDATTVPGAEGGEYIIGESDVPPEVILEPDEWPLSYPIKRSPSPPPRPEAPAARARLESMREEAKRRRTREEEDYRTRRRVEQEEADIRIQILKTELLIKKEILKQEVKRTNAMDKAA